MIASLYQSGSPAIGASVATGRASISLIRAGSGLQGRDGEDAERLLGREVDGNVGAALGAPPSGDEVGDPIRILPANPDGRQIRMQDATLGCAWVDVDRNVDGVPPA